jgi:hypothetical protein
MQFVDLYTRIAEETGLDVTADATKLKAWVNEAYRFLAGLREWSWMLKNGTIQTTADITTLTATVNAAATAVTLSSTYATSLASDYYIQFSDTSDDWYLITAHTAGTDTLTISPAYTGSSNLTAGTTKIRRVFYSLASDADRIIDMYEAIEDRQLVYVDPRELDHQVPDPTSTGTPQAYTLLGYDTSNAWRAHFYPIPSAKINIQYRYYKGITDLSATGDVPVLPSKWHTGIIFVALSMFAHPYIDDDRMASAESRARQVVSEMIRQQNPLPDKHTVIQPWDARGRSVKHIPFPSDFDQYGR